ncbi:hypothetical protein CLF_109056 [Clonorchis sinensis]|uniref:Uncharacterized protein n=1 Tax=Clonorchis sinensis TaxID=79923 RepID=G7YIW1_CLOSI|nr:hypothetical protein CLF_109056 [Clonorchis sinensis]
MLPKMQQRTRLFKWTSLSRILSLNYVDLFTDYLQFTQYAANGQVKRACVMKGLLKRHIRKRLPDELDGQVKRQWDTQDIDVSHKTLYALPFNRERLTPLQLDDLKRPCRKHFVNPSLFLLYNLRSYYNLDLRQRLSPPSEQLVKRAPKHDWEDCYEEVAFIIGCRVITWPPTDRFYPLLLLNELFVKTESATITVQTTGSDQLIYVECQKTMRKGAEPRFTSQFKITAHCTTTGNEVLEPTIQDFKMLLSGVNEENLSTYLSGFFRQ